jgi:hypothetical protein
MTRATLIGSCQSGVESVLKPLFPLFPPEALEDMKQSGSGSCCTRMRREAAMGAPCRELPC